MKQIFMFAISFSLISFTHGYLPMHKHLRMHNKHDSKFQRDHVSSNGIVKIGEFSILSSYSSQLCKQGKQERMPHSWKN